MKLKKVSLLLVVALLVVAVCPAVALAQGEPLLNLQMYFIDKDSYALPGYVVTIDNDHQSITNKDGVASFPAVDATGTDTFKLYSPDGKTVLSTCNLSYQKSGSTGVGPSKTNGEYVVNYSTDNATIYIVMVADPNGNSSTLMHPAQATDTPPKPGKQKPQPSPSASASPSATAKPTPAPTPVTNPSMEGYLVDENGKALSGVTIQSTNDKTGKSLSATSDTDGYYKIPGLSAGAHTLRVFVDDSTELGKIKIYVENGETTEYLDVDGDGILDIRTGLAQLYMNFQVEPEDDAMLVLDVSDKPLGSPESGVKATGLKLNVNSLAIDKGETFTLNAKVQPNDAAIRTVSWQSSDPAIAKVDANGNVTALKTGKVTITTTTMDGTKKNSKCEITVV